MVVIEKNEEIFLFDQHEHAKVCGEFASEWREDFFLGKEKRDSVLLAITEHDNGWIELDKTPLVNPETKVPYSFINYPLNSKIKAYTNCINRVQEKDDYAALICSLHYASFFENYTNGRGEDFISHERKRQKTIMGKIDTNEEDLKFHYHLLQFCDHLSLYLCMNDPGVEKKDEFIWFRRGFAQKFHYNNGRRLVAHWVDQKTVALTDFPFKREITVSLKYKAADKNRIDFIESEYASIETKERIVTLVKG